MDVRQHDEAALHEELRRLERLDRVGHQVFRVGVDLKLEPVGLERLAGELGREDRLARGAGARGVGEQAVARGVEVPEDVVRLAARPDAAEGHRDQLGAGGLEAPAHDLSGAELPGSDEKPGRELDSRDD